MIDSCSYVAEIYSAPHKAHAACMRRVILHQFYATQECAAFYFYQWILIYFIVTARMRKHWAAAISFKKLFLNQTTASKLKKNIVKSAEKFIKRLQFSFAFSRVGK